MSAFNYTKIHLFEKNGIELPLIYDADCKITIPNKYGDDSQFFPVVNINNTIEDYYKNYAGIRYSLEEFSLMTTTAGVINYFGTLGDNTYTGTLNAKISETSSNLSNIDNKEYTISGIDETTVLTSEITNKLKFPSITFDGTLHFDEVSVDLIETQTLYVLTEKSDINNTLVKLGESSLSKQWAKRYKILFFIDCRKQTDFRFFTIENDDVIWSDKIIMDLDSSDESSYRVNIGFTTSQEGSYEQNMYVCLLDTGLYGNVPNEDAVIYPIGQLKLCAEAIGEDERYRTLFTNFGIPDPINYSSIFNNADTLEPNIDYIKLNENSKKLFLTYSEIFPYVGTYKALINAISTLGYDEIFFKEWYKYIGEVTNTSNYVAFDMSYKSDPNANVINNISLEERIQLRKLNWVSMMYRINQEISGTEDRYGFLSIESKYGYNNSDIVVKLIALSEWLQRYIIGLNCRIVDIGGEGIYFERYRLNTYGNYQQVYEWNNVQSLSPFFIYENECQLIDGSANIKINVGAKSTYITLEDIKDIPIKSYCEGFFTSAGIYHAITSNAEPSVYVGPTLESLNNFSLYQFKASSKCDSFIFDENNYLEIDSPSILIFENSMQIVPLDIFNGKDNNASFEKIPSFILEQANLRDPNDISRIIYKIYPDIHEDTIESYILEEVDTRQRYKFPDYVNFYPKSNATLAYNKYDEINSNLLTINSEYTIPYSASSIPIVLASGTYVLEILDGKLVFNDNSNSEELYLNFNYDTDTKFQNIEINKVYYSNEFKICKYKTSDTLSVSSFIPGNYYLWFYTNYMLDNSEEIINYDYEQIINVKNSGNFVVDVYAKDYYGNIFANKCNGSVYVNNLDVEINLYSKNKTSNNELNIYGEQVGSSTFNYLKEHYIDFCIYDNLNNIKNFSKDDYYHAFTYPNYAYAADARDIKYVNATNNYDKFTISGNIENNNETSSAIYKGYFFKVIPNGNIHNKILNENDLAAVQNDYAGTYAYDNSKTPRQNIKNFALDYSKHSKYSTINLIVYNELGKYPIMQLPGIIIHSNAIPFTGSYTIPIEDQGYYVLILDDSKSSYVWTKVTNSARVPSGLITTTINGNTYAAVRNYSKSYYVKSENYTNGAIKVSTSDLEDNEMPSLEKLSKVNYVSLYIQPTWKIGVSAHISANSDIIKLTLQDKINVNLKKGDVIKLIFENEVNSGKTYIGQSSFKVDHYNVNENVLYVNGKINEQYTRRLGKYVLTEVNDTTIINALNAKCPNPTDEEECILTIKLTDVKFIYRVFENIGGWYYELRTMTDSGIQYVQDLYDSDEKINMYVSYSHGAYVNYTLDSILSYEDISGNGISIIADDNANNKLFNFIDSTFTLNTSSYNFNNGLKNWMDCINIKRDINNLYAAGFGYKAEPKIISNSIIYKYSNNSVSITSHDNIVLDIEYNNIKYVLWRIYKYSNDGNRELLFDSFNPLMYLNLSDIGLYDVEAIVFDKYGNCTHKINNGMINVKK